MCEDPNAEEIADRKKDSQGDRNMVCPRHCKVVVHSADQFVFGLAEELAERRWHWHKLSPRINYGPIFRLSRHTMVGRSFYLVVELRKLVQGRAW
jgi:hypothetical protein